MPVGNAKLSLLPFPQFWNGNALALRFLCLPKGDPRDPLKPGLAEFAEANLVFEAKLIGSLDSLPAPSDAIAVGPLTLDPEPVQKAALFEELTHHFNIKPRVVGPAGPAPRFRKPATDSYRALIGRTQRSNYLVEANDFACALHQGAVEQPADPVQLTDEVTWGRVIGFALRQPNLAMGLGLLLRTTVELPDPGLFTQGGWLYIDLHPTSEYAAVADIAARYAARIPPLTGDGKTLFAPMLFPVTDAPGNFISDDVYREAERYADGLCKQVHCAQTGDGADGISLAWEDEQIAEWFTRQVDRDGAGELKIDAPLGISGYRVDVRNAGADDWNSLVAIESVGDLKLGPLSLGPFDGEAVIEVTPAQISPKQAGMFWFPSYFATWRGSSLALSNADLVRLHARPDVVDADTPPNLLGRDKNFVPVEDAAVPLLYGKSYEFRVRMSDLTRGGPGKEILSPQPPRNSIASLTFQRRKAPGPVEILQRPSAADRRLQIAKPRLGYPEVLFTGAANFADLEQDLDFLAANPDVKREMSLPDPDVLSVEIDVHVKALDGDAVKWFSLYRTTRDFAGDDITIDLDIEDHATLLSIPENQYAVGSLVIPSAREIRLTLTGIGRDDAGYFIDEQSRRGAPVNVDVRADAATEAVLLTDPDGFSALRSFFFQPPPPDGSVASPIERLAAELKLNRNGLTLSGPAGKRTVIACSAGFRHTISPEGSALTVASDADLIQRWVNVVQFTLERDWTWYGLDAVGISVTRIIHLPEGDTTEPLGTITLPRSIDKKSLPEGPTDVRAPERQSTELIFFDAFDPKPKPPRKFPCEITIDYVLQPAFEGPPLPAPVTVSNLLPVATPPSQTPRIVSAGIALSEYGMADDYSSTEPRKRMLWFEFAEPPEDPEDAYFVRLLAMGPDPMLLPRDLIPPDAVEAPLPIDPEWMRLITPGQPRDRAGLSAMNSLNTPAASTHYLIPLPANLNETSPELFGFFVYEVRIAHTDSRWCLAQSRYGATLRIAGAQHPPPPLVCQAARNQTDILIRAPFATAVIDGANVRPRELPTHLWALLYARVPQTDAKAYRNILLRRAQLFAPLRGGELGVHDARILYGEGLISLADVESGLRALGLPQQTPLTALAAEIFADPAEPDPLGERLGHARTLRISPLIPIPDAC